MVDEDSLTVDLLDSSDLKSKVYNEPYDLEITVYPQREPANLEQSFEINKVGKIRLALEELNCFEVVDSIPTNI